MITFGLKDLGMGIFLVLVNLFVVGFTLYLSWRRYQREKKQHDRLVDVRSYTCSLNGTTYRHTDFD